MAVVRKKQDDKHLKTLREIVSLGGNKQCFDCGQRGPTYVNMTIGSFVCTRCSGLLRGITPPHRVKSISMATFTSDEIEFIRSHGNDLCAKTWLGLWDAKRALTQDQRDLMVDKYERKRYFLEPASPLKSLPQHTNNAANSTNLLNGLLQQHNGNGNNGTTNGNGNYQNVTPIALTPPASLRLTPSNRTAAAAAKGTNGIATQHNFHTQFTPDDQPGGLFGQKTAAATTTTTATATALNNNNNNSPSFNGKLRPQAASPANGTVVARHGMSGLSGSQAANGERTSARLSGPPPPSSTNSTNGNKFTPDGDFGSSDFGGSGGLFGGKTTANGGAQRNGTADNANADFADFEHNAIFNAAAHTDAQYSSTPFVYGTVSHTPMQSTATNQWNMWQQFQLPTAGPPPVPEQNRWSLPMSLSSTSAGSLNSSGSTPFNSSSSSINSTPPVDRYAALKDLDMQLREVVKDTGLFTSHNSNGTSNNNGTSSGVGLNNNHGTANGNGTSHLNGDANPFKAQQQQQQQLQFRSTAAGGNAATVNPFQPQQQQLQQQQQPTAWATDFANAVFAGNGVVQQQQQQQQHHQMSMFGDIGNGNGFSNGYGMPAMQANGFGMMQRNPFAATTTGGVAARSNNPFL